MVSFVRKYVARHTLPSSPDAWDWQMHVLAEPGPFALESDGAENRTSSDGNGLDDRGRERKEEPTATSIRTGFMTVPEYENTDIIVESLPEREVKSGQEVFLGYAEDCKDGFWGTWEVKGGQREHMKLGHGGVFRFLPVY